MQNLKVDKSVLKHLGIGCMYSKLSLYRSPWDQHIHFDISDGICITLYGLGQFLPMLASP